MRNITITNKKGLKWEMQPAHWTPKLGRPFYPVLGTKESVLNEPDLLEKQSLLSAHRACREEEEDQDPAHLWQ